MRCAQRADAQALTEFVILIRQRIVGQDGLQYFAHAQAPGIAGLAAIARFQFRRRRHSGGWRAAGRHRPIPGKKSIEAQQQPFSESRRWHVGVVTQVCRHLLQECEADRLRGVGRMADAVRRQKPDIHGAPRVRSARRLPHPGARIAVRAPAINACA